MIKMQVDAENLEVMLRGIDAGLSNLTPVWNQVRNVYVAFVKEQFKSEGSYTGSTWKPLNPAYAKWKAEHAPGKSILRLRDRLYGSLTNKSHSEHIFRTGPSWMEYGTSVFYARIHQTGSLAVTNRPPKRTVIPPLTKAEGDQIVDIFAAYLFKRARMGR